MTTPAVETPVSKSAAVVQSDQNVRTIEDKFGAPTTRSGQTVDDNFTNAVISSYSNLTHAPVLCALFFSLLILTLAEYLEMENGPLEVMLKALYEVVKKKNNKIFVVLANLLIMLLKVIIAQKDWLLNVLLISVPYFRKPSSKNLKITIIFSILAVIFESSPFVILLFSQAWFLVTELRNPKFKMIIALIMAFIFLLNWIEVKEPAANVLSTASVKTTPHADLKPNVSLPVQPVSPSLQPKDASSSPSKKQDILQSDQPSSSLYDRSPFLQNRYTKTDYESMPSAKRDSIRRLFTLNDFKKLDVKTQIKVLIADEIDPRYRMHYLRHTYNLVYKAEPTDLNPSQILEKLRIYL